MQTHAKKQITIIVERPLVNRLTHYLEREEVTGYTVLPALGGSGSEGAWSREGMIGDTGQMVQVVCILDPARLDAVLDGAYAILSHQIGIVTVQDVSVVRPERF